MSKRSIFEDVGGAKAPPTAVPARSREDEVRLDLTIVIARLSAPIEEGV